MRIQAEVSLYPLRTQEVGKAVAEFVECLRGRSIGLDVGPMSTRISGDSTQVFNALHAAFVLLAEKHQAVLTVTVSNACPESIRPE